MAQVIIFMTYAATAYLFTVQPYLIVAQNALMKAKCVRPYFFLSLIDETIPLNVLTVAFCWFLLILSSFMEQSGMAHRTWWGNVDFTLNETRSWYLGGLTLQVQRAAQEWQISYHRPVIQQESDHTWHEIPSSEQSFLSAPTATVQRHIFNKTSNQVTLKPQLADLSVVIQPVTSLFVSPNQQTTLFVSTPVWLNITTDKHSLLLDTPIIRPSDTWFGANTIKGEICYATQVLARLDLEQLPIRPFRAVTPIHIVNRQNKSIPIERVNIPVPLLSLYAAEDGRLWTPTLEVEQFTNSHSPKVTISKQFHPHATNVVLLSSARRQDDESFTHLFENFFN